MLYPSRGARVKKKFQPVETASSLVSNDRNYTKQGRNPRASALKWIKHSMLISFYDDPRDDACDACGSTFFSYAIS
jgi:hypothetical protein